MTPLTRRDGGAPRTDDASGLVDRVLRVAENVVYGLIGLVLLTGAVAVIVATIWEAVTSLGDGVVATVTATLDPLLLVFVLVELFGAVRETVKQRQLLAEPFLLVGIIVAIKEIVVGSIEAGELLGTDEFTDVITEIAVLTGLLLVLGVASFLLRRKEREPAESDPEVA